MWPVFPRRSSPTCSLFLMNHPLGWHGFREDFSLHLLILPSLFIFLHPYNHLDVNSLFIFNCKMFWEVNYTRIFVWRRPCNLIDYSKMAMCLIAPVILCLYTGCCSVRLVLLIPMSAPGVGLVLLLAPWPGVIFPGYRWSVSFHCRRAFAETEESCIECVWMLLSFHCCVITCLLFLRTGFYFTYG